tara:strand:+ start:4171 stop:4632 length:462 start_codon:yes stop_codon:yes gene_type:complete
MSTRRTNKGQIIDFDALLSTQGESPAVGNTGTDAKGNIRDPKTGDVIKPAEVRVREYYRDNPQTSDDQVSLKGKVPEASGSLQADAPEVKTAKTQKENIRTQKTKEPEPEAPQGESFDEQQPLGYREVELPNGDIEMVPYYTEDDAPDDKKSN